MTTLINNSTTTNNYVMEKLKKCYKYRNYDTAIFLASALQPKCNEYELLKGILLYENGEYTRSLFHLKELQSTTAIFYMALNYKQLKKYQEAIVCIFQITENKTLNEPIVNPFINEFKIDSHDTEFYDSLLGQLYTLKGKAKTGIEKHRKSFFKSPLLNSIYALFDENVYIEPINDLINDPVMTLYQDLFKVSISKDDNAVLKNSLSNYINLIPSIGSYYISKIASIQCRFGESKMGLGLFDILRQKDPYFIYELDVYSTSLWFTKNENLLGLLAKDLITSHPNHYITWSVIGNYYSLKEMTSESTICLMKSLSIQENPFAYSLMGFEFNSKNQFLEAQSYFKSSIYMLENNDKAFFGLGIALNETFKKQAAESYFKKALLINSKCMNMKTYLIRFYVKHNELSKAIELAKEYLNLKSNDINEITKMIEDNFGKYTEIEELIICEIAEVFAKMKYKDLARKIIDCVQCRTSTYYSKKSLIENDN